MGPQLSHPEVTNLLFGIATIEWKITVLSLLIQIVSLPPEL